MNTKHPNEQHVFDRWPGRGKGTAQETTQDTTSTKIIPKVPSTYSYSKASTAGEYRQWGYSICDDSDVVQWTKLELEPRTTFRELEVLRELVKGLDLLNDLRASKDAAIKNDVPRFLPKESCDIVRDYLGKVAREWYSYMSDQPISVLKSVPIDIVLTHPAVNSPFWRVFKFSDSHR